MLDSSIILNHSLVPKHEVLSKTATEKLFKDYKATKEQLPKILSTDPVAKSIGAKKGEIVKITRSSLTAGKAVYYRVVV
jgi:DNA-directed RNA polymerase subunit H